MRDSVLTGAMAVDPAAWAIGPIGPYSMGYWTDRAIGPMAWAIGPMAWAIGPMAWAIGPMAWAIGPMAWAIGLCFCCIRLWGQFVGTVVWVVWSTLMPTTIQCITHAHMHGCMHTHTIAWMHGGMYGSFLWFEIAKKLVGAALMPIIHAYNPCL